MSLLTLVMLAAAEFDNANLVALAVTFHRSDHLGRTHVGRANGHRRSGADQQHLIEFDAGALVCVELLDTHHGTFLDAVLFTARGYHGIHCCNSEDGRWGRKRAADCIGCRPAGQTSRQMPPSARAAATPAYGGPPSAAPRQSDRS